MFSASSAAANGIVAADHSGDRRARGLAEDWYRALQSRLSFRAALVLRVDDAVKPVSNRGDKQSEASRGLPRALSDRVE